MYILCCLYILRGLDLPIRVRILSGGTVRVVLSTRSSPAPRTPSYDQFVKKLTTSRSLINFTRAYPHNR